MSEKSQTIGDFAFCRPSQILPIYRIIARSLSQYILYSIKFYTARLCPEFYALTICTPLLNRKGSPIIFLPLKMLALCHT